jgi:peptide/nickel transport system substrate-binding protein
MCDGSYAMMSQWCDPSFDEIYAQALSEMDDARRAELFREIFTIVADERVYIHLFQLENMAGVTNAIEWSPRPDEYLWMFDAKPVN